MLCLPLGRLGLVMSAAALVACAGAAPVEPKAELEPYVAPFVSGRLTVRVVDVDPRTEPQPPVVSYDLLDDERFVDPEIAREEIVAKALGGVKRPTLDCFAPGQEAADIWIVGRSGSAGHVRALDVASTTAGREATRCVLARLWKSMLPQPGLAFSYRLHVEPWNPACTTVDCEALPDPVTLPRPRRDDGEVWASAFSPATWVPRIRRCYNMSLARDPSMGGTLRMRLVIGEDGVVRAAVAESSTITDTSLVSCIQSTLASSTVPVVPYGPTEIIFPFTLTSAPTPPPVSRVGRTFPLDRVTPRDLVGTAESKGMRAAVVPGSEDEPARPFVVFVEKDGHVASIRRVNGDVRPEATRRTIRTGDVTLVFDDPDLAYDAKLVELLQR